VQTISAQVAPGHDLAAAMVEIERVLRRVHTLAPGRDNDFTLLDRRQFLATQQETTQILGFLLAGIAGVSLVVGGIGIMNIMLVTGDGADARDRDPQGDRRDRAATSCGSSSSSR
jgi:putative ABC transport system permease protein